MKQRWFSVAIFLSCLLFSVGSFAASKTAELLKQMRTASLTLNYEIIFINVNRAGIESMRFRHAVIDNQPLAQLLQMDGATREVLMRNAEISYFFEQGIEPFSIGGDHIVDSLPSLVFADFTRLEKNYDFLPVGRARVANRACQVIRVVARDGFRYSYVVWVDELTKLPLQIELLDRNGEQLEQFRVLSFVVGPEVQDAMKGLITLELPPLLALPPSEKIDINWAPDWVPEGFKQLSQGRRNLPYAQSSVDSRMFSDGLFSFTISVSPVVTSSTEQYLHQGKRTLHAEFRDGYEIIIVGELPLATAKRIADNITLKVK